MILIEAAKTCQRNIFSEINIAIRCNAKIMCGGMIKDGHRKETSLLDVPIIMKYVLFALSLSLLFVIQPDISLR